MLRRRFLLALCSASISVGAARPGDGNSTFANSTNDSTPTIGARHPATRKLTNGGVEHLDSKVGGSIDILNLDNSQTQRHNGQEIMRLWARQNSTPSTTPFVSLITVTVTKTTVVEVASETQVLVSTLVQTLTFIEPVLITETSTVSVPVSSSGVTLRKRDLSVLAADFRHDSTSSEISIVATGSLASTTTTTSAAISPYAVRRQVSNEAFTVIGLLSVVTIETTVTLTRTGSFISTATVFSPIFVSVTATPTVTITWFVTTIIPIQTSASSKQDTSTNFPIPSTSKVALTPTAADIPPRTSSSVSQPVDKSASMSTPDLTTSSATSSSVDPKLGVTTWFSWESENVTSTTSAPAPTATQITTSSAYLATTPPRPSEALSEPALGPAVIAGITVAASATALFFVLVLWLFCRRPKRRHPIHATGDDYRMTPATAAAAIIDSEPSKAALPHDRSAALASEASGASSCGDGIRIVIQPTTKSRGQSSGLSPITKTWPRPPGYTGEAYSFSTGESSKVTPQEPKTWSNASEYGGSSNREGLSSGGAQRTGPIRQGERILAPKV